MIVNCISGAQATRVALRARERSGGAERATINAKTGRNRTNDQLVRDPEPQFSSYTGAMPEDNFRRDQTTRSQWNTLDASPRSRRGLGQSTIMSAMRQAPIGPFSPLIAGLVFVVTIGVTIYVGLLVRLSMRESMHDSLQTVLAANVGALELWLADQRQTVTMMTESEAMKAISVNVISQNAERNGNAESHTPDLDASANQVLANQTRRLLDSGYVGWAMVDPLGNVLLSSDNRFDGGTIPLSGNLFGRLNAGHASVTRPFSIKRQLTEIEGADQQMQSTQSDGSIAIMCAIAPLRQDSRTIGALALMIDPSHQFSDILTLARMGDTGETYAFDRDAVLLSRSRFESQLTRAGLLGEGLASPLRIHIRNPQVDIRDAPSVQSDPKNWPMTKMADSATRGGGGFDVVGYDDYRGVPVVGAWRWLGEYDFGVATEIDVEEAFAPLKILRNSFVALLCAVTIAGASLFALAWVTRPRDQGADRVEELKRRLGQYDLQQRIGRGGMGTVYLGAHGLLDRKVAIKVLENADATERSLARFQREVQLSASLKHPNTIEIYDFGRTDEGTFFYVMEFVDGISLEQLVDYYGRQPAERVIYLLLQICGSLAEAHDAEMVHRDIKPANVLLTSRSGIHDLVKVLDFGLAKQLDHDSMQLTRVDSLTGTPLFMSPESIRDAASADVLSDIYSIGAVGYTLLCGYAPFDGDSSTDVCAKKLHDEPELPEHRIGVSLAKDLQALLMRCLRLDPSKRPQSAKHLATELLACEDSPHWTQQDAALWWREIFDGPYLDDFEISDSEPSKEGTQGDTAVNEKRPTANVAAQSTAN